MAINCCVVIVCHLLDYVLCVASNPPHFKLSNLYNIVSCHISQKGRQKECSKSASKHVGATKEERESEKEHLSEK